MKIIAVPQYLIEYFPLSLPQEKRLLISITGRKLPPAKIPENDPNNVAILRLKFDDIDQPFNSRTGDVGIDESQAKEIVDRVMQFKDKVSVIVIHCLAGISRSRGVAAALCSILGENDSEHYKQGVPNTYVKNMVLEAYQKYYCHEKTT